MHHITGNASSGSHTARRQEEIQRVQCVQLCVHAFCLCAKAERVWSKNTPSTFVPNRYDGGMVTVCTIDRSVTDAAHCLGCVDRLSGGHSTTVIHSDVTRAQRHIHTEKCNLKTAAQQRHRRLNTKPMCYDSPMHSRTLYLDSTTPISFKSFGRCISCSRQPFIRRTCYTEKQRDHV